MKVPRFQVATCEGYSIASSRAARPGGEREPGLSATVCDSWILWREIKTYRSSDRVTGLQRNAVRGREGALRDAEDHAAYLNEWHRREMHAQRVREYRAEARAGG